MAVTSEDAVAACSAGVAAVAIIDAESIRGQEWTVVQTLKAVCPTLPVILLGERKSSGEPPAPQGVYAVASSSSPTELFNVIDLLAKETEKAAAV